MKILVSQNMRLIPIPRAVWGRSRQHARPPTSGYQTVAEQVEEPVRAPDSLQPSTNRGTKPTARCNREAGLLSSALSLPLHALGDSSRPGGINVVGRVPSLQASASGQD